MFTGGYIYFARTGEGLPDKVCLRPDMANRHGFICGATGTGKTITLKVLAESFSDMGVPVFLADVKGDLSGMIEVGADSEDMIERKKRFGLEEDGFSYKTYPTAFFDFFGEKGIPLRTTISEMGPQLMASVLDLNDTQTDILSVVYKIADDQELLLTDTKDLKAILSYVSENASDFELDYGHIAKQSVAAIVRAVVALESEDGDIFFGEPAFNVSDFFVTDISGRGTINILDSSSLINKPRLYSAFMLYLLSELFEIMPEVGDMEKPRIVFFFDEAHLLFDSASDDLLQKIEQMIKLIRSKGVGVYFVTQSPGDIPDGVMSQLGNKVQHALRAYTPKEQKVIKAAAESFRAPEGFDTEKILSELGTGEAVVSVLDEDGVPGLACHAFILPPQSKMGQASEAEKEKVIKGSNLYLKYNTPTDPESAYEFLERRKSELKKQEEELKAQEEAEKQQMKAEKEAEKAKLKAEKEALKEAEKKQKELEKSVKSVATTAGGTVGRELGNLLGSTFGGSFGKRLGGNLGASLGRNILGTLFKH